MEDRLGSLWWYEAILFQKIFPKKVSLACISKFCVVSELLIFYEKIAIFGRGAKKKFFSKKIYISENTQNFEMHARDTFFRKNFWNNIASYHHFDPSRSSMWIQGIKVPARRGGQWPTASLWPPRPPPWSNFSSCPFVPERLPHQKKCPQLFLGKFFFLTALEAVFAEAVRGVAKTYRGGCAYERRLMSKWTLPCFHLKY